MQIKDTEVRIIKGDLTRLAVDAIVCPVDSGLQMQDGLAAAVRRKGGREIEEELRRKGPVMVGEAVPTVAGKLKEEYVIHAVMMEKGKMTDEAILRHAFAGALKCADELNVEKIAFPALGCAPGGFPVVGAAKIAAQEMIKYLRFEESSIQEIVFCLGDQDLYRSFEQTISGYITHIRDRLGEGPYATVDIIIELPKGIVLIERSNPPYGWALPGGFVDYGESLEAAVIRETREETTLEVSDLRQFHTYSEPGRDPRFHTISTVFVAKGKGKPRSGDDAKNLKVVPVKDLSAMDFVFDHKKIIGDYLRECHRH